MSTAKGFSNNSNYQHFFSQDNLSKSQPDFKPPIPFHNRIHEEISRKFTSAFFQDHCEEEYVFQRAFNSNNFTYLRKLPDNPKHGDILNDRKQKVTKSNLEETLNRAKNFQSKLIERQMKINQKRKQQIGTLGYFTAFDYQQSNYEMPKIIDSLQRIQNEKKRKQISELDFRPSGIETKMKFQDPFKYVQKTLTTLEQSDGNKYLFPFHLPEDTYDTFQESQLRRKIISDSLKLNGDFIPAKKDHTLTKVNKQQMGDILNQIQFFLKKYLKDVGFFIGVTKNDSIEVLFEQKFKEDNKISLMMSKICEHEMISKFLLRRHNGRWGYFDVDKKCLVYCMLPCWVKNPVEDLKRQ